jgi:hypothetical protein
LSTSSCWGRGSWSEVIDSSQDSESWELEREEVGDGWDWWGGVCFLWASFSLFSTIFASVICFAIESLAFPNISFLILLNVAKFSVFGYSFSPNIPYRRLRISVTDGFTLLRMARCFRTTDWSFSCVWYVFMKPSCWTGIFASFFC